jgi:hypothetical protein
MSLLELFKKKGLTIGGYLLAFIIILNTILFFSFYGQHRKNLKQAQKVLFLSTHIGGKGLTA